MAKVTVHTHAEMEAYYLFGPRLGGFYTTGNNDEKIMEACDYIIGLAERIKSSRAHTTMQYAAQAAHK